MRFESNISSPFGDIVVFEAEVRNGSSLCRKTVATGLRVYVHIGTWYYDL